jgi:hypothetical protein
MAIIIKKRMIMNHPKRALEPKMDSHQVSAGGNHKGSVGSIIAKRGSVADILRTGPGLEMCLT